MYLREKKIKWLRVRNVLLAIFGVFELFDRGYYIISEFVYYRDDPETAWNAVSMKSSLIMFPVAVILLIFAAISRKRIGNAVFYSSCFEADLDGYLQYSDLAAVTGKPLRQVAREIRFCRRHYMQKFEIKKRSDGGEYIELFSKTALCECKNCGAQIEKRMFFTGTCPYCDSSDLTARVLSGDQFYSISNDVRLGTNNPDFYKAKNLSGKKALFIVLFCLGTFLAAINLIMVLSDIPKLNDMEYMKEVLFDPSNHLYSFEQIRAHVLDGILFSGVITLIFTPLAVLRMRKSLCIRVAQESAGFFAKYRVPFVEIQSIPDMGVVMTNRGKMRKIRDAIRHGYLKSCTFEMHDGKLMAALAKKVVKNQCPGCGASITGAVDADYTCSYCGRKIMGVIEKK